MRVQPGARRVGFVGRYGDVPKLAVAARPVDGAANDEVSRVVADAFGLRPRDVVIVQGRRSRTKRLSIETMSDSDLACRLDELLGP